ncbi:MAG: hypothetical protein KBD00_04920 [Candidatus Peribacteraceae bacterium]|nr:hypothetical protein [Candidatus Peribacteraceae bacterium]
MPLKHHTETAFLLILMLIIAVMGIAVSLLPPVPDGLLYWGLLFALSLAYPVALLPLFRDNRADYEFRFLHWFPAFMLLLWLLLQSLGHMYTLALVLLIGMTFLWSLPLVFFGAFLLIFFALHVIRRRVARVGVTLALMAIFLVGSVLSEAMDWNKRLSAAIFPRTVLSDRVAGVYRNWFPGTSFIASITSSSSSIPMFVPIDHAKDSSSSRASTGMSSLGNGSYNFPPPLSSSAALSSSAPRVSSSSSRAAVLSSSRSSVASSKKSSSLSSNSSSKAPRSSSRSSAPIVAINSSSSVPVTISSSSVSSSASSSISPILSAGFSSSIITDINSYNLPAPNPQIIASRDAMEKLRKRKRLPRSGPEDFGVIALTLLASYSAVIHYRARKRI